MATSTKKSHHKKPSSPRRSPAVYFFPLVLIALLLLLVGMVVWLLFSGKPLALWPSVTLLILIILLIIGIVYAVRSTKTDKPHQPDYYTLFIMGLLWAPLGIVMDNYPLSAMGIIFLFFGLKHKSQWRKPPPWSELSPEKKKLKLALMILLGLLVVVGLITFLAFG